jgi:nucleotide-binding universal stress UspA family protein
MVVRGAGPPSGPVLVGVDGSAAGLLAAHWAAAEALRRHATLHLLHVVEASGPDTDAGRAPGTAVLDAVVAALPDPAAAQTRTVVGDPATVLLGAASRAQLVVIGPRGTGGQVGARLGAVARALLWASPRPTVVVHGTTFAIRVATGTVPSANG